MENGRIYGGGNDLMALLENSHWVSSPSPSFHENMVNFDQGGIGRGSVKRDYDEGGEEVELSPYQPEKKRRLSPEQVEFLEKSFEVENKLEPERKLELAKQLGLQPRQVAIWFQNRRARYKTKQLEIDFGSLKASYDSLKLDFDSLSKERDALQIEVKVLTKKLNQRDETQIITPANLPIANKTGLLAVPSTTDKHLVEESSSAKSDVVDSESPHYYAERNRSSVMDDPTDQQSDFSQEEDEHLMMNESLLVASIPDYSGFLKVEENECYEPILGSSCNFSLVDDQTHLWSYAL